MVCFPLMVSSLYASGVILGGGSNYIRTRTKYECMESCFQNSTCISFFFSQQDGSCFLCIKWFSWLRPSTPNGLDYFVIHTDACQFPDYQFLKRGHMCIKIMTHNEIWTGAKESCELNDARLVKIDTEYKMADMMAIIQTEYQTGTFWIGASDDDHDHRWKWTDGSDMSYTSWSPGQPDNLNNMEQCASLREHLRGWNDEICTSNYYYICEKPVNV